jgi:DNA phosphorothioation-associated putative methyltransferase
LAKSVLVVAARLTFEKNEATHDEFADGCLTGRGTFQKFYTQDELRDWVKATLAAEPVSAAPGVLLVFRDSAARLRYEASRWRRRATIPGQQLSDKVFEANERLLEPLMAFVADRGRLPDTTELPESVQICQEFGSLKRAFGVITHATGSEKWDRIHEQRKTDLMVYLALDRFGGRPKFTELPQELQWDVKALFRSYRQACSHADELLFSAGNMQAVNAACASVKVGKLTPEALYVHRTAIESLPELLRVYEGCARAYIGNVEGANIVKLNRTKPKISYLAYPEFDSDPHPALEGSLVVSLRSLRIRHFDYRESDNPPILHRKEEFVAADYPARDKFARLTKQEERYELYEDPVRIGTRDGWNQVLVNHGLRLSGHRVVRRRLTRT